MTRLTVVIFVLLICNFCNQPRNSHVLPDPSLEKNFAMIKYMDDNGVPVMASLVGAEPITIASRRSYVDLAIQDGRTPTERFVIKPGADVSISYDMRGNFVVKQDLGNDLLPFDMNYLRLRDSILFENRPSAMSEFVRYWMMLELNGYSKTKDQSLLKDLDALRDRAYVDLSRERQFLDSLGNLDLMSPERLEFYRLLNKFDSIRLGAYPDFGESTKFLPDEAIAMVKPKTFGDKKFLTFYDDWMRKY